MGGNVFSGMTEPISISDIGITLSKFEDEIYNVFPEFKRHKFFKLGSTGKKPFSGDIDLGVNKKVLDTISYPEDEIMEMFNKFKKRARTATDEQLIQRAKLTYISNKLSDAGMHVSDKSAGSGSLFFEFPQYHAMGLRYKKNVQVDLNFGDPDWLKFTYHSAGNEGGNIKGLHRTQLILHMFAYKGYVMSHNYGVKHKNTQEIMATTPAEAIDLLKKLYKMELDERILSSYKQLFIQLKSWLNTEEIHGILDIYLKTLDSTRCDVPSNLHEYWIEHKDRLGLTGKYLPENSKLIYKINQL